MKKVTFNTKEFKKIVQLFTPLKTGSSVLPILENILINCNPSAQSATLRSTDLVIDMEVKMDCQCDSSFMFLLPSGKLNKAFKFITEEEFTLNVKEIDVELTAGDMTVSLRIEDYNFYPKSTIPENNLPGYILSSLEFNRDFTAASRFTSKDELRPSMMHVNLTSGPNKNNKLCYVATDAYMMIFRNHTQDYCGYDIMIPSCISQVSNIAFKIAEPLVVFKNENRVTIAGHNCKITVRVTEDSYPNWEGVLPKDDIISLYIKTNQIKPILSICELFSNSTTKHVKLDIKKESIKVIADNIDLQNSVSSSIMVFNSNQISDKTLTTAFNSKIFLKAISVKKDEFVKISHSDLPNKAIVINSEILIMPLMLNDNF